MLFSLFILFLLLHPTSTCYISNLSIERQTGDFVVQWDDKNKIYRWKKKKKIKFRKNAAFTQRSLFSKLIILKISTVIFLRLADVMWTCTWISYPLISSGIFRFLCTKRIKMDFAVREGQSFRQFAQLIGLWQSIGRAGNSISSFPKCGARKTCLTFTDTRNHPDPESEVYRGSLHELQPTMIARRCGNINSQRNAWFIGDSAGARRSSSTP